jgi:hypothetical protein
MRSGHRGDWFGVRPVDRRRRFLAPSTPGQLLRSIRSNVPSPITW